MSAFCSNNYDEVRNFREAQKSAFQSLIKGRITEIVEVNVLEEFIDEDFNVECNQTKRLSRASEWLKEKRKKDQIKKKETITKKGVIGAQLTTENVQKVKLLFDYLDQWKCLQEIGLFRKTGNLIRQKKLEDVFNFQDKAACKLMLYSESFSPHDVAGLLKYFLREIPEPLLNRGPRCICEKLSELKEKPHLIKECLQLLILLLPENNCMLLQYLLNLLNKTVDEKVNKMTADTLGVLFAPHILSPRPMDAESLKVEAELGNAAWIMSFMIKNARELFQVPECLIETIKSITSNKQSTVYVKHKHNNIDDIEPLPVKRFAMEDVKDQQDFQATEMAKLYANIVSMKDSAQKRKLLKKIGKEEAKGLLPKQKRSRSVSSTFRKLVGKSSQQQSKNLYTPPASTYRKLRQWKSDNNERSPETTIFHDPKKVEIVHHYKRNAFLSPLGQTKSSMIKSMNGDERATTKLHNSQNEESDCPRFKVNFPTGPARTSITPSATPHNSNLQGLWKTHNLVLSSSQKNQNSQQFALQSKN